jgi:hypothetical protein
LGFAAFERVAQVGSVTTMACFVNSGVTYLASGDEHGTVAVWRVL